MFFVPELLLFIAMISSIGTIPADSSLDSVLPENTVFYAQSGGINIDNAQQYVKTMTEKMADPSMADAGAIDKTIGDIAKNFGAKSPEFKKAVNSTVSIHVAITGFLKDKHGEPAFLFVFQSSDIALFESILKNSVDKSILAEIDNAEGCKIYGISDDYEGSDLDEEFHAALVKGKYVAISNNMDTIKAFIKAAVTNQPKPLAANPQYQKVKSLFADKDFIRGYFDFAAFEDTFGKSIDNEWAKKDFENASMGMDFETLGSIGFACQKSDGRNMSKLSIFPRGDNKFMKTFFNMPPTEVTLANCAPADSLLFMWTSLGDAKTTWGNIKKWLSDAEPYLFTNEDILGDIKEAEDKIGMTIDEIAGCIGNETAFFGGMDTTSQLGFSFGVACLLKDPARAKSVAEKLDQTLSDENTKMAEKEYKGVKIRYNEEHDESGGYCFINDKYFVAAGPSLSALEKVIDAIKDGKTLATTENYKKKMASLPGKMSKLAYFDIKGLKEMPMLQMFGAGEMLGMFDELIGSTSYTVESPSQASMVSDSPLGISGGFILTAVAVPFMLQSGMEAIPVEPIDMEDPEDEDE